MESGGLCVMMGGTLRMQGLSADSWVFHLLVWLIAVISDCIKYLLLLYSVTVISTSPTQTLLLLVVHFLVGMLQDWLFLQ